MASIASLSVLAFAAKSEKSWMNAVWMTPSDARGSALQAVEIFERTAMHLGPRGGE